METYRQLMDSKPSMPERLEQGAPLTPGILGGRAFLDRLPRRVRRRFQTTETHLPWDHIVRHVANLYGLRVDEIISWCRERRLVQARALIAWYATEQGGATLSEVARRLHRDVSTLSRTVGRYRRCHPELFSPRVFAALQARIEPPRADRETSLLSRTTSFQTNPRVEAKAGDVARLLIRA